MDVQDAGRRRGVPEVRNEGISLRITSLETAEDRQRRDRQQIEMKKALLEQVQDKERRKQEARQRELEEDRRQEEKIRKQLAELNEDFQREAGGGKHREEFRASPVRRQPKQRSPTPVPAEVEVKETSLAAVPARLVYVKELWREKEELNQKQAQLQQLISELRENATAKQHNPSTDFEAIRKETFGRPAITRAPSDPWASLRDSSRFISSTRVKPLAQVGHRLVTLDRSAKTLPGVLMRQTQDYSMVESAEVRSQLGKLDGLLDFCKGGELPQTSAMSRLQIQRQGNIQSLSPTRDSPELRGNAQSVSLDFMLPSN